MKKALVLGGGGFIGNHLVEKLKAKSMEVCAVDLKLPEFNQGPSQADQFTIGDLREPAFCKKILSNPFDEIYQLAADMGGAEYILSNKYDAQIVHNSCLINLNVLNSLCQMDYHKEVKVFYSSSACVYPEYNQEDPSNPNCREDSVYPAQPDSEYGWEKLFAERLFSNFAKDFDIDVRIARFHNVFGPRGTFQGGREKAPAAICRKVACAQPGTHIEIFGDGKQTRSFLYIEEALEGILRLMHSSYKYPLNIGSDQLVSINDLAREVIAISGKDLSIYNIDGPIGVRGRNSDNNLIEKALGWRPNQSRSYGLEKTYHWIQQQMRD